MASRSVLKDTIHVDGFDTRAGSAFPPEVLAEDQAPAVTALREAGVLVLGKTVMTEFGAGTGTDAQSA